MRAHTHTLNMPCTTLSRYHTHAKLCMEKHTSTHRRTYTHTCAHTHTHLEHAVHHVVTCAHIDRARLLLGLAHHQDIVVLRKLGLSHLCECVHMCVCVLYACVCVHVCARVRMCASVLCMSMWLLMANEIV